jgi:hypothetical protein
VFRSRRAGAAVLRKPNSLCDRNSCQGDASRGSKIRRVEARFRLKLPARECGSSGFQPPNRCVNGHTGENLPSILSKLKRNQQVPEMTTRHRHFYCPVRIRDLPTASRPPPDDVIADRASAALLTCRQLACTNRKQAKGSGSQSGAGRRRRVTHKRQCAAREAPAATRVAQAASRFAAAGRTPKAS